MEVASPAGVPDPSGHCPRRPGHTRGQIEVSGDQQDGVDVRVVYKFGGFRMAVACMGHRSQYGVRVRTSS